MVKSRLEDGFGGTSPYSCIVGNLAGLFEFRYCSRTSLLNLIPISRKKKFFIPVFAFRIVPETPSLIQSFCPENGRQKDWMRNWRVGIRYRFRGPEHCRKSRMAFIHALIWSRPGLPIAAPFPCVILRFARQRQRNGSRRFPHQQILMRSYCSGKIC